MPVRTPANWIDCAKCLAIVAVIVDHTNGILYKDTDIAFLSYFSVTLFVLLSGMTSFFSNKKHESENIYGQMVRRFKIIFIPYIGATLLCHGYFQHKFDLIPFLKNIVYFNSAPPFYFVVFYIQLLVISPFLYRILQKSLNSKFKISLLLIEFAVLLVLSKIFLDYTFILDVHGGGKNLFGATYLIVFFLGMVWASRKTKKFLRPSFLNIAIPIAATSLWAYLVCTNRFGIDKYVPFGAGFNPPSLSLIVYAVLMCWLIFSLFTLLNAIPSRILKFFLIGLSQLGRYSLYIFLYHWIILVFVMQHFAINSIWIKRGVYMTATIALPSIGGFLSQRLKKSTLFHATLQPKDA